MKPHDLSRTLKVSPHAASTVNKLGCGTQLFKCQPKFIMVDVLMKSADQALELLTVLQCRRGQRPASARHDGSCHSPFLLQKLPSFSIHGPAVTLEAFEASLSSCVSA
jgi:hypothetical protein